MKVIKEEIPWGGELVYVSAPVCVCVCNRCENGGLSGVQPFTRHHQRPRGHYQHFTSTNCRSQVKKKKKKRSLKKCDAVVFAIKLIYERKVCVVSAPRLVEAGTLKHWQKHKRLLHSLSTSSCCSLSDLFLSHIICLYTRRICQGYSYYTYIYIYSLMLRDSHQFGHSIHLCSF